MKKILLATAFFAFSVPSIPTHAEDSLDVIGFEEVEKQVRKNYEEQLLEEMVRSESQKSANLPSYTPPSGDTTADLIARLDYMDEEIRNLKGEVARLEHEVQNLEKLTEDDGEALESVADQYVVRPGDINEEYVIKVENVAEPETELDAAELEEQDFDAAIIDVSNQDLAAAKEKFKAFIVTHPDSEKLDEAYFWIGEIAMDEGGFKEAALNYLKSYKADKGGDRAEEALLKSSTALGKIGKKEEACRNLTTLKDMEGLQEIIKQQAESEAIKLGCAS